MLLEYRGDKPVQGGVRKNINKEVFNIIDDNNNNGELSGANLEESSSSYSKTLTLKLFTIKEG
jgi:hypothetical protein